MTNPLKYLSIALVAGMSVGAVISRTALAAEPTGPNKVAVTDPILLAMQQELDRERDQLLLPGMQKPYFIEYRVDDYQTYEAVANFGALTQEERNHQRIVRVTVRIGDYTIDSSSSRGRSSLRPKTTIRRRSATPSGPRRTKPTRRLSGPTRPSRHS